jgi:hypothetical protein
MKQRLFIPMILTALACNNPPGFNDPDTDTDKETGNPETGFPSSFLEGKFRISSLQLNALGDGQDLNGDGTPDNNLPNALGLVDIAIADQDFSRDGFNTLIEESIATNVLNILLDGNHAELDLALLVLSGTWDPELEVYGIDSGSFGEDELPLSDFLGEFSSETTFSVAAQRAILPVTFQEGEAPLPVPLEGSSIYGELSSEAVSGQIIGVIPGQEMVDNVLTPMIPEEGASGMTKEEIIDLIQGLTTNETLMDVPLSDSRRGISAAFTFEAAPQEFE